MLLRSFFLLLRLILRSLSGSFSLICHKREREESIPSTFQSPSSPSEASSSSLILSIVSSLPQSSPNLYLLSLCASCIYLFIFFILRYPRKQKWHEIRQSFLPLHVFVLKRQGILFSSLRCAFLLKKPPHVSLTRRWSPSGQLFYPHAFEENRLSTRLLPIYHYIRESQNVSLSSLYPNKKPFFY